MHSFRTRFCRTRFCLLGVIFFSFLAAATPEIKVTWGENPQGVIFEREAHHHKISLIGIKGAYRTHEVSKVRYQNLQTVFSRWLEDAESEDLLSWRCRNPLWAWKGEEVHRVCLSQLSS